ncbi:MAG: hypothetical protein JWM68_3417, partial [Verrucomicrobiales bacterium]|nr:hypothetical protein [Verrucomicrobiales bacterium]
MNPAPSLELGARTHLVRMTYAWRIAAILPPVGWLLVIWAVVALTNQPLQTGERIW